MKLRHLSKWNEQRRDRARGYEEQFAGAAGTIVLSQVPSWSRPVYHLYAVRVADRERVQEDLAAASVGTGIHYPIPVHLLKAYEALGFRPGDFPVAEQVGRGGAVACGHRGPEVAGREVKPQEDAV